MFGFVPLLLLRGWCIWNRDGIVLDDWLRWGLCNLDGLLRRGWCIWNLDGIVRYLWLDDWLRWGLCNLDGLLRRGWLPVNLAREQVALTWSFLNSRVLGHRGGCRRYSCGTWFGFPTFLFVTRLHSSSREIVPIVGAVVPSVRFAQHAFVRAAVLQQAYLFSLHKVTPAHFVGEPLVTQLVRQSLVMHLPPPHAFLHLSHPRGIPQERFTLGYLGGPLSFYYCQLVFDFGISLGVFQLATCG